MDSNRKKGILYIVVPCYNEEEALETSAARLKDKLLSLVSKEIVSENSRIVFVDDGSRDGTWEILKNWLRFVLHTIEYIRMRYLQE